MSTDYEHPLTARSYRRARALSPEAIAMWAVKIRDVAACASEPKLVLDLGCGVGRFLKPLAMAFPQARILGVEPALAMIQEAGTMDDPRISIISAKAPSLPLASDSFDIIFVSMVFHYFPNPIEALFDCCRVLRPGGKLLVRSGTKETVPSFAFLRDFPAAMRIEKERMPTRRNLMKATQSVGLAEVTLQSVEQVSAKNYEEYYERVRTRGFPSLVLISDDEFEKGLTTFNQSCRLQGPSSVPPPEIVDLVIGRKPK